jgi:hypothetical protein
VPGAVQSILDNAVANWPDRPAIDLVQFRRFILRDATLRAVPSGRGLRPSW